jgi:hypothetical protein
MQTDIGAVQPDAQRTLLQRDEEIRGNQKPEFYQLFFVSLARQYFPDFIGMMSLRLIFSTLRSNPMRQ